MKRTIILLFLCYPVFTGYAQTNLEDYFNLCLEFGAPQEIVRLFQDFRASKEEDNGTVSYVAKEDNSLLKGKPYSEYQIWYTIDKDKGLYQSTLILRGDKPTLQNVLSAYLKKMNALYGDPVYTNLLNGGILVFWYNDKTFAVKARLILDIVNNYKFVSITYCSPMAKHTNLLRTLYNGTVEEDHKPEIERLAPPQKTDTSATIPDNVKPTEEKTEAPGQP